MSLEDFYQEIILDHNKRPRNFGPLTGATHAADGNNPLCGDELRVSLIVKDGRIRAIRFQGQGCAISKASASLMTEKLTGMTPDRGIALAQKVLRFLESGGDNRALGTDNELISLSAVRRFPARIKCATLAWHAFLEALPEEL